MGFPFFGELIRVIALERTETAYSQQMFFKAIELAIDAQEQALRVEEIVISPLTHRCIGTRCMIRA